MTAIKFEVGKFYADRKGRKWEVVCVDAAGEKPIVAVSRFSESSTSAYFLKIDGTAFANPCDADLIAEWREEPRKPREWNVFLMENNTIWDITCDSFSRLCGRDPRGSKRIKVREVLDEQG